MTQIINKIEKENFGLKLKIHFLEESLRKSGPGFNEAALQENTDLKVDRITLQKELVRCKKMLSQAERDVEALRRHIAEVQEQAKHKKLDAQARRELETLQAELVSKDHEIEEMRDKIQTEESKTDDLEKLRVEIEELASDLRDKDRMLEERDDEIETIKARTRDDCAELEDELDEAKRRIEELEEEEENAKGAASDLQRAKEALQDAEEARDKAEANLDELQEEMANKSITTKGLSRQIEEKAIKLEDDLINMREMYSELQQNHEEKARDIIRLQEVLKDRKQDADVQDQRLRDQNELLRNENESLKRRAESADRQVQQADEDLRAKAEAKDLLHSRHDALTTESQQLQKDLRRAQALSQDLQRQLELEKGRAQQNELELKSEARDESARLVEEVSGLRKRLDDHSNRTAAEKDAWQTERRNFETQKKKMEEQASGLQRTISRLQETEGNLSDKESQIRRALESEKQRHHDEEAILEGQVKDLNADVAEKRQTIEELRREVSQAQERQREGEQDRNSWEDRVQSLEDEIVVLQAGLDEEAEKAQEQIDVIQEEANTLRSQLDSAKEQLSQSRTIDQGNIEGLEKQLEKTRSENQSFHDRLATKTLELQTLQASMMNVEAERDELQSQLKDLQSQVDDTFRIDQDKIQIRSAKLRLEKEVDRLRGEQKCLKFEVESLERLLADESKRNHSEQAHLNDKIQNLQQEATTSRRSDVADSRTKIQRLEARIADLQEQLATTNSQEDKNIELSVVHKDLSAAREKEIDLLEREAAQKSKISNLKQQLDRLQRQIHEAEIARLGSFSPESVDGSARKNEIVELRRQLVDTQKELKDTRSDFRKDIQTLQKKLTESEQQIRQLEEKREQKEADIFSAQQLRESLQNQNATSIATISRLRTRIASLEKDPRTSRPRVTEDDTIAEERRDLHELLKDAKLEAEDLQNAIGSKDSALSALASREKELRANLKRMREERSMHEQKSIALASELDRIQHRHEKAVDQFSRRQLEWDQERRAMVSRVRFPNTSFSELHGSGKAMDQESKEVATQHMSELRGLAKQIQWLKARCQREKDFRAGLVYEKNFLLMRIGMFEAWYVCPTPCSSTRIH